jgi:hypothetical protein
VTHNLWGAVFKVPILILGFNRPDLLKELVSSLRKLAPTTLLIAIDGPRSYVHSDEFDVLSSKKVLDEIDWHCEIHTLFRQVNLGCGEAVSSAIDWAFTIVEEVIILEDDIRPSGEFFLFCEQGLSIYRDHSDIFTLGGFNRSPTENVDSDLLSAYPEIWGWATWKTKWGTYNNKIGNLSPSILIVLLQANGFNLLSTGLWLMRFLSIKFGRVDTWDYQLVYWSFVQKKYHLISSKNLVSNVGFDDRATHTTNEPRNLPMIHSVTSNLLGNAQHDSTRDKIERKNENAQLLHSLKKTFIKRYQMNQE